MKQILCRISLLLVIIVAILGLSSCEIIFGQELSTYELDSSQFDRTVVYNSELELDNLVINATTGSSIKKIPVTKSMIKRGDTNSVGTHDLVIEYGGETWTISYEVVYEIKFIVDGEVRSSQYAFTSEDIIKPEDPQKPGTTFLGWSQRIPDKLSDNMEFIAIFTDSIQIPKFNAVYGDTLADLELPEVSGGKWQWDFPLTTSVGDAGNNQFDLWYIPNETAVDPMVFSVNIKVEKKKIDILVDENTLTFQYDGNAHLPLFSLPSDITEVTTDDIWVFCEPKTEIGKYTFKLRITHDNYEGEYDGTFEITKIPVIISVLLKDTDGTYKKNVSIKYGEQMPDCIYKVMDANGNEIEFIDSSLKVSLNKPSMLHAGDHYISATLYDANADDGIDFTSYYKILEDNDESLPAHLHVQSLELTLDDVGMPQLLTPDSIFYGDKLSSVKFVEHQIGYWTWKLDGIEDNVGEAGPAEFTAIFIPNDSSYNTLEVSVSFTVQKKILTIYSEDKRVTYNGEEHFLDYYIKDETTGQYMLGLNVVITVDGEAGNKCINANEAGYTVTLKLDEKNYYAQRTQLLIIDKAYPSEVDFSQVVRAVWRSNLKLGDIALPEGYAWENPEAPSEGGFDIAGTYTDYIVIYTPADTANYKVVSNKMRLEISKAEYTYEVESKYPVTYNGTDILLAGVIKLLDSNNNSVPLQFKNENGDTITSVKESGTYKVNVVIKGTDQYEEKVITTEVIVNKAIPNISIPSIVGWTYGRYNAIVNSPTGSSSNNYGTVAGYKYYTKNEDGEYVLYGTDGKTVPVNAGTYYVVAYVEEGANHAYGESPYREFVISKAEVSANIAINSLPYTGSIIYPDVPASEYYTVSEQGSEGNLGGINAGKYFVTLTLVDDDNYKWSDDATNSRSTLEAYYNIVATTITINPLTTGKSFVFGEGVSFTTTKDKDFGEIKYLYAPFEDPNNFTSNVPTNVGAYYVKAVVEADYVNGNWKEASTAPVLFNITKATVTVPSLEKTTFVYTSGLIIPVVVDNDDENKKLYDIVNTGETNVGTHSVTLSLKDEKNYKWSDVSGKDRVLTYSITFATPVVTTPTIEGWIFGNVANAPEGSKTDFGTIVYQYRADGSSNWLVWENNVPVNAGKYYVRAYVEKDSENNNWVANASDEVEFIIEQKSVNIPEFQQDSFEYTGNPVTPTLKENSDFFTLVNQSALTKINCGEYTVEYKLINGNYKWSDGTTTNKSITYRITQATVTVNAVEFKTGSQALVDYEWIYNTAVTLTPKTDKALVGTSFTYAYEFYKHNGTEYELMTEATKFADVKNAGAYMVKISVVGDSGTYKNYVGGEAYTVEFTINKATYDMSGAHWVIPADAALVYDGAEKVLSVTGLPAGVGVGSYEGEKAINAGNYTAKVNLSYDSENYYAPTLADCEWSISRKQIEVPTIGTNEFEFNRYPQTYTPDGFDSNYMTISGNVQTDANGYSAVVELKNSEDATNYEWKDVEEGEKLTSKVFAYTITKKSITDATVVANNNLTFIGLNDKQTQTFTVTLGNVTLTANDYTVTIKDESGNAVLSNEIIKAGTYTVTVLGKGNYDGVAEDITFNVEKKPVPVPVVGNAEYTGEAVCGSFDKNDALYSYVITPGTNVSDKPYVTFTLTDEAFANYKWERTVNASVDVSYGIYKATPVISGITAGEREYNGSKLDFTEAVKAMAGITEILNSNDVTYITVRYYNSEKREISTPTDVGNYYIKVKVASGDNWNEKETEFISYNITPKVIVAPTLSDSNKESYYTEAGFMPSLDNTTDSANYTVTYKNSKGEEIKNIIYSKDAGTYTITVTLNDSKNYEWSTTEDSKPLTFTYTITKNETNVVETPVISDKNFDGQVTNPSSNSDFGTAYYEYYKLGTDGEYHLVVDEKGNAVKSVSDAGTYKVVAKVNGNDNYAAGESEAEYFTISPAVETPTVTATTGTNFTPETNTVHLSYTPGTTFDIEKLINVSLDTENVPKSNREPKISIERYTPIRLFAADAEPELVTLTGAGWYKVTYLYDSDPNYVTKTVEILVYIAPQNISGANVTLSMQNGDSGLIYTGNELIQSVTGVTVKIGSTTVTVPASDYTVTYTKGTDTVVKNAGTYTVTVTINNSESNFTGTATTTFDVAPRIITAPTFTGSEFVYNGGNQKPTASNEIDKNYYTYVNNGNTNVGNYSITVSVKDEHVGNVVWSANSSTEFPYTIKPRNISDANVTLSMQNGDSGLVYTGEDITQSIESITLTGVTGDITYNVSGLTGKDVGEYTVILTGTGNFTGTKTVTFKIAPKSAEITAGNKTETYNGSYFDPADLIGATFVDLNGYSSSSGIKYYITVYEDGKYVEKEVTEEIKNEGEYNITVKLTDGNFTAVAKSVKVTIGKKSIAGADIVLGTTHTYSGAEKTQEITSVKIDGLDVTYTVTGNTGTDAGDYTLTIKGSGNFEGEIKVDWSILKAEANIVTNVISDNQYTGTTGYTTGSLVNPTAMFGDKAITDATFKYYINDVETPSLVNHGTYTVKVVLVHKNYECELTDVQVTIKPFEVDEPTFKPGSFEYDGADKTVTKDHLVGFQDYMTIVSGATQSAAGTSYVVKISLTSENYTWKSGSDGEVTWAIDKQSVPKPNDFNVEWTGSDIDEIRSKLEGDTRYSVAYETDKNYLKDVGTYTATLTLNNTDNYKWSDSNESSVQVTYTIAMKVISWTDVTFPSTWQFDNTDEKVFKASATHGETTFEVDVTFKVKGADDTTYTPTLPENAGTYIVKFTATDADNTYSNTSITREITITPKPVPVPDRIEDKTFDGIAIDTGLKDTTEYKVTGNIDDAQNVGKYSVTFTLKPTEDGIYNYAWEGKTGDEAYAPITDEFEITPATIKVDPIVPGGWTYGDTAPDHSAVVQAGTVTLTEKQYTLVYYDKDGKKLDSKPTDADTYYVGVVVTGAVNGDEGYNWYAYETPADERESFVIGRATVGLSTDNGAVIDSYSNGDKLTYTGTGFTLDPATIIGTTYTDVITGEPSSTGIEYSVNAITSAGDHVITVTLNNSNYETVSVTVTVKVEKKSISVVKIDNDYEYTYTAGVEQSLVLQDGALIDIEGEAKAIGHGTYTAILSIKDAYKQNYKLDGEDEYRQVKYDWTIAKATPEITVTGKTEGSEFDYEFTYEKGKDYLEYIKNLVSHTNTDSTAEVTYSVSELKNASDDAYSVTISLGETANFNAAESVDITVKINRRPASVVIDTVGKNNLVKNEDGTYTLTVDYNRGTAFVLESLIGAKASEGNGEISYLIGETVANITDKGDYTVTVKLTQTENYTSDTATVYVVVNPFKVNVPELTWYEKPYNGDYQKPDVDYNGHGAYHKTPVYSNDNSKNVDDYTVTFELLSDNYVWNTNSDGSAFAGYLTYSIKKVETNSVSFADTTEKWTYGTKVNYTTKSGTFGEVEITYYVLSDEIVDGELVRMYKEIEDFVPGKTVLGVGDYKVVAAVTGKSDNYNDCDAEHIFKIEKKVVTLSTENGKRFSSKYTGKDFSLDLATLIGTEYIDINDEASKLDVNYYIGDSTTPNEKITSAGLYTVTIKLESANYEATSVTVTVDVGKKVVKVPGVDDSEFVYNGTTEYGSGLDGKFDGEDNIYSFEENDTDRIGADTYTVTIWLNDTTNYEWEPQSEWPEGTKLVDGNLVIEYTVAQAESILEVAVKDGVTYNSETDRYEIKYSSVYYSLEDLFTVTHTGGYSIKVDGVPKETTDKCFTNVDTYEVVLSLTSINYEYKSLTITVEILIKETKIEITPKLEGLKYDDGDDLYYIGYNPDGYGLDDLFTVEAECGYTIQLNGVEVNSISIKDFGTSYVITLVPIDTTNYDVAPKTVTVRIDQIKYSADDYVSYEGPITYGDLVKDVFTIYPTAGGEWKIATKDANGELIFADDETTVGDAGSQTFFAVFVPDEGEINYTGTTKEYEITVSKASIDMSDIHWGYVSGETVVKYPDAGFIYNGSEYELQLMGSADILNMFESVTYSGHKETNANADNAKYKATATFTLKSQYASNYEVPADMPLEWHIGKAQAIITPDSSEINKDYDSYAPDLGYTVTLNTGLTLEDVEATITYKKVVNGVEKDATLADLENVGTYKVYYTLLDDPNGNYVGVTGNSVYVTVNVTKATVTFTNIIFKDAEGNVLENEWEWGTVVTIIPVTESDFIKIGIITGGNINTGEIVVTYSSGTVSGMDSYPGVAGVFTITVSITDNGNYKNPVDENGNSVLYSETFVIGQADNSWTDDTIDDISNTTYGTAIEKPTGATSKHGDVVYQYRKEGKTKWTDWTAAITLDAGTYEVRAIVREVSGKYVGLELPEANYKSFTVAPANATISVDKTTVEDVKYNKDGNFVTGLFTVTVTDNDGEVISNPDLVYTYDGNIYTSLADIKLNGVDDHEITISLAQNGNYASESTATVTVCIVAKETKIEITPKLEGLTYDKTKDLYYIGYNPNGYGLDDLFDVTAECGYTIKLEGEEVDSISIEDSGTYVITLVPIDTTNYDVAPKTVTVRIDQIKYSADDYVSYEGTITYGDLVKDVFTIDPTAGGEWKIATKDANGELIFADDETTVGDAGSQTFFAVFVPDEGEINYAGTTKEYTINVSKATIDMSGIEWGYVTEDGEEYSYPVDENDPSNHGFTYTGDDWTVVLIGLPEGITVTGYSNNSGTTPGGFTASFTGFAGYDPNNYELINIPKGIYSHTWQIKKILATVDVTVIEGLDLKYNGNAMTYEQLMSYITVTLTGADIETPVYKYYLVTVGEDGKEVETEITSTSMASLNIKNADIYTIRVKLVHDYYYGIKDVNLQIKPAPASISFGDGNLLEKGEDGKPAKGTDGKYTLNLIYKGAAFTEEELKNLIKASVSGAIEGETLEIAYTCLTEIKNVNEYNVTVAIDSNSNYAIEGGNITVKVIVSKATIQIESTPVFSGTTYYENIFNTGDYAPTVSGVIKVTTGAQTGTAVDIGEWKYYATFDSTNPAASTYVARFDLGADFANYQFADDETKTSVDISTAIVDGKSTGNKMNVSLVIVARVGNYSTGTAYGTIENAVTAAASGSTKTVWVSADNTHNIIMKGVWNSSTFSYSKEFTIPSGVTVILPYDASGGKNSDGKSSVVAYDAPTTGNGATVVRIDSGVTVIVKGTLEISGVLNGGSTDCQFNGNTATQYAELILGDNATLKSENCGTNDNGILSSGYITGSDTSKVVIDNGGKIYQPLILRDFEGGAFMTEYKGSHYDKSSTLPPFKEFHFANVQTELTIYYGGRMYAWANLYANRMHNHAEAPYIGYAGTSEKFFMSISQDGYMTAKYDPNTQVTEVIFDGGATMDSLNLSIVGVQISTARVYFPLSWLYDITLRNGTYNATTASDNDGTYNINLKLMWGSKMTIEEDATLNVSTLAVYNQASWSTYKSAYTDDRTNDTRLYARGKTENQGVDAQLIVRGTLNVANLGGAVYKEGSNATVNITGNETCTSKEVVGFDYSSGLIGSASNFHIVDLTFYSMVYTKTNGAWTLDSIAVIYYENSIDDYSDEIPQNAQPFSPDDLAKATVNDLYSITPEKYKNDTAKQYYFSYFKATVEGKEYIGLDNILDAIKTVAGKDTASKEYTITAVWTKKCKVTVAFEGNAEKVEIKSENGNKTVNSDDASKVAYYPTNAKLTVTVSGGSDNSVYEFTNATKNSDGTYTVNGDGTLTATASGSSSGGNCITGDTLITLADGTQKRVDQLTGDELLLVWNLETGKYDFANIIFVDSEEEMEYEIIHLYFSDGSEVKVISEHGFFDLDLGEYVYIDAFNYSDYIGHRFVTQGDIDSNIWNEVILTDVVIERMVERAWSPVTFKHLCYYTNGLLSMPGGATGLFNIFEVDTETMTYDIDKMNADIEMYGLFTYEDFEGMIPEIAFEAFNGAWLKVAMGKGMLTWEDIAYLAERYMPLM